MTEDNKQFVEIIILLTKFFNELNDKFFAQKLYNRISGFVVSYVSFVKNSDEGGVSPVAQYKALNSLLTDIDNTLELLDNFEYLKILSSTPLLFCRKSILSFKVSLLKGNRASFKHEERDDRKPFKTATVSDTPKIIKKKLNQNKERILGFLKKTPNSRTKDIIGEFSALSERTVKRSLKDLTKEGFLDRRVKDKAVYYSVIP